MSYQILGPDDPALAVLQQQLLDHPEWEAELIIVPWAEYQGMLDIAFQALRSPYQAVCVPGHIWLPGLVADGRLESFDTLLPDVDSQLIQQYNLTDIMHSVYQECLVNDEQYLLPLFSDGHIMFYRKDLINLPLSDQSSTLNPREIPAILEKIELSSGQYPFALKAHASEILLDWLPYLWAFNGKMVDESLQPAFNSHEAIQALEFYTSLKHFCPPDTHLYGNIEILNGLKLGKVAMAASWGGQAAPLLAAENPFRSDFATTTFTHPWNTTWGVSIPSNQTIAAKTGMLAVLYQAANPQQDREVTRLAGSPVRSSSYLAEEMGKYSWLKAQKEMLERRMLLPTHPGFAKYLGPLYANVYAAFIGEMTASEALNKAASV